MFSERLTFHYVHIFRKLVEFSSHLVHYMVSFLICFFVNRCIIYLVFCLFFFVQWHIAGCRGMQLIFCCMIIVKYRVGASQMKKC